MVRVTDVDVTHKYKVSRAQYGNHASNRRVEDPVLLAFVDELHAAGSKPKLIVQYLRKKTGKNVLLCDVHNRVAKMKEKQRGYATAEERLEAVLRRVGTRQMRRWFKAFPEAMLVDAMHNTNEWRYKLFSFMVNDVYSHSQYVYHSPMENESAECLTDAIGSFKFQNTMWEKIKVIVIDKDVGELGVLEKQFPGVRIILCHFHLKKYIRTEMVKSEYGGPSSFDRDQVEDAVYMMRLAASPEEYTKYLKYMYFLLDRAHLRDSAAIPEPVHPFLKYFIRNWDSMKERWALYARSDVPHLGNHTNNKLESLWAHISNILRADMALDECVDTLMFLQAVAEMEYSKKTMDVGQMRYDGADAELKKRPREVSPYAYRLIEQQ
ncbi:hypothetical protein PC113_g22641 [Phytophthora cactorum]|uniref:ZSWIM1/3 RNaseH-like domain-containing protein n=1 Tax=Phytophthora cactorum TaxID=29920 RepID=A0A8T0Y6V6_9STRA|nr:hypothetical protein PC113_g22641 [Phytophthora cactorum]